jgi:hypothetical protein
MDKSEKIYTNFLKKEIKNGSKNDKIQYIIRDKIVVTEAEYKASIKFYNWVLENITNNYKIIGGNTWRFGNNMLFPKELVNQRMGLNQHLWNKKTYININ